MVEPVNDNILNLVNELYNNLDAKDKIINEQALEIARLKKDKQTLEKLCSEYIAKCSNDVKTTIEKNVEYIERNFGDKENE